MEKTTITAKDGYVLNIHLFEVDNPKGYIQIIHGMEEHQERYEAFASYLNDHQYTVITSNMRGHGDDAPLLGYFKDHKGYEYLLDDQKRITDYILKKYSIEQVILFAHSMGSIIARNLMQTESENYSKVILSGYPNAQPLATAGIFLANTLIKLKGPKYYSPLLENIAVGTFNKQIKNPETDFDWLSYNKDNVRQYIDDPYCGHGFKVSALCDLFTLVTLMHKKDRFININKDTSILFVCGKDDPCTGNDTQRTQSKNAINEAGFSHIQSIEYDHMRHEILNENDYRKVYNDIYLFIEGNKDE